MTKPMTVLIRGGGHHRTDAGLLAQEIRICADAGGDRARAGASWRGRASGGAAPKDGPTEFSSARCRGGWRSPLPSASGRCGFGQETFAGATGSGQDAPIPAVRGTAIEPRGSTPTRHAAPHSCRLASDPLAQERWSFIAIRRWKSSLHRRLRPGDFLSGVAVGAKHLIRLFL